MSQINNLNSYLKDLKKAKYIQIRQKKGSNEKSRNQWLPGVTKGIQGRKAIGVSMNQAIGGILVKVGMSCVVSCADTSILVVM